MPAHWFGIVLVVCAVLLAFKVAGATLKLMLRAVVARRVLVPGAAIRIAAVAVLRSSWS